MRRMHDEISKKLTDELSMLDSELYHIESELRSKRAMLESLQSASRPAAARDQSSVAELVSSLEKELSAGRRPREASATLPLERRPGFDAFASAAALPVPPGPRRALD